MTWNYKIEKIVSKIQEVPENTLSKDIIIPLYQELGYHKVEFYGGTNEYGKDILLWEIDKIGDIRLTVVQVKRFKFTNTASDSKSLQSVFNQLTACFKIPILYTDQRSYFPSEAFLISTYPIDSKSLHTRFGPYPDLNDQKIKIIDGTKLASLILTHSPNLVKKLIGFEIEISEALTDSINNDALLKAMGYTKKKNIKNIYTDTNFYLGKISTELFFSSTLKPIKKQQYLSAKEWEMFKSLCSTISNEFVINFIDDSFDEIDKRYNKIFKVYLKQVEKQKLANKSFKRNDKLLTYQSDDKRTFQVITLTAVISPPYQNFEIEDDFLTKQSHNENKWLEPIVKQLNSNKPAISKLKEFYDEISEKLNVEKKNKLSKETIKQGEANTTIINLSVVVEPPKYQFVIDGKPLADQILKKRKWIEEIIREFNIQVPTILNLKEFIQKCTQIIGSAKHLFLNPIFFSCIGYDSKIVGRSNFESARFKLAIQQIFDTGLNITVLGHAGAGKSTSLQMYALRDNNPLNRLIIPISLAQAMQNWHKTEPLLNENIGIQNLELGISEYLYSKGILLNTSNLIEILESKPVTILLDGLDEVIRDSTWLPKSIAFLSKKYSNNLQLIVTSRESGSYLNELPFFEVTLMPFTNEQRDDFIEKWFEDDFDKTMVSEIKSHLNSNKYIADIVKNPLLTTMLCILRKNGIKLPSTEITLYDDRLKLLTGYYDRAKNINFRLSTPPNHLELIGQKIAYYLHSEGKRSEQKDQLIEWVKENTNDANSPSQVESAINELIDPCNILVPMTDDGGYGFGHLRFQEHLAAKELFFDRKIKLSDLIRQIWWRDVLLLFSQLNREIDWILENVELLVNDKQVLDTLFNMIEQRPENEKEKLKEKLDAFIERSKIPDITY